MTAGISYPPSEKNVYSTAPTVHSPGHRSNPQGVLFQAEWLGAGEVDLIWPDFGPESGCIHLLEKCPNRCKE